MRSLSSFAGHNGESLDQDAAVTAHEIKDSNLESVSCTEEEPGKKELPLESESFERATLEEVVDMSNKTGARQKSMKKQSSFQTKEIVDAHKISGSISLDNLKKVKSPAVDSQNHGNSWLSGWDFSHLSQLTGAVKKTVN